jgi:hypothetical protein
VSDESHAKETPDSRSEELTADHIQRLLRNADRLAFGIRPAGFVLINRTRLLAANGISQTGALLIDQWVAHAGGGVQPSAGRSRRQLANRSRRQLANTSNERRDPTRSFGGFLRTR